MATLLYLTPADQGRALTLEEFERADALEGFRYELIDGRLEVSPEADLPHDRILRWLNRSLGRYADSPRLRSPTPYVRYRIRAGISTFAPQSYILFHRHGLK